MTDGRRERLTALFDAHEGRLYRVARRLVAAADDASDLVQETFLKAAGSLRSVPEGHAKEEAWLVRVLVNLQRDHWRKAAVRKRWAPAVGAELAARGSDPEASLMAKQAVWSALDLLQPRRRAVVILHEFEGMSPGAIASMLGIREMTVRWHLSTARKELKRVLAPYMGERT